MNISQNLELRTKAREDADKTYYGLKATATLTAADEHS
jgi:hypothetical protein